MSSNVTTRLPQHVLRREKRNLETFSNIYKLRKDLESLSDISQEGDDDCDKIKGNVAAAKGFNVGLDISIDSIDEPKSKSTFHTSGKVE